jgi:Co/Zn/Cd efflux system component
MSSTWLCSRNDLIANVGVLVAASSSYLLVSRWPDIIIQRKPPALPGRQ